MDIAARLDRRGDSRQALALLAVVLVLGGAACGSPVGRDAIDPGAGDVPDVPADLPPDLPDVVVDVPADLPVDVPGDAPPDTLPDAADALADVSDVPADVSDVPPDLPWLPASPGGFRRIGDAIVDGAGRTVAIHGVNASNGSKYLPGNQSWHTAEDFQTLAAAGFDSVRLLTFWSAVMPQEGVIDTAYLDAYATRVQWAADAGLLVVIDMHQDVFGVGFHEDGAPLWACDETNYQSYVPAEPWYMNYLSPQVRACFDRFYSDDVLFGRFVDAWKAVAERFKDHPAVLGFDLLNEPNPGSYDASRFVEDLWQPRQEQVAAALASIAPDRIVFFEGATLLAVGVVDPFVPSPDPRVAFAPHYYLPTLHDGGSYDSEGMVDYVDQAFEAVATSAASLGGVPVWMGEWGGPTWVPGFDAYLEDLLTRFVERRWSWAIYSDDVGGFGIREPDRSITPALARRLGHPRARRLPGPVTAQHLAFDPTGGQSFTATFEWASPAAALEAWTGPAVAGATTSCTLRAPGSDAPRPCAAFPCLDAAPAPAGVATACLPAGTPPGTWELSLEWSPGEP